MWVIKGTNKELVELVSLDGDDSRGVLPVGTYLTAEDKETKHILRVESSQQYEPYSPSPMIIESGLETLIPDQKCQNIITAVRIMEIPEREDGMSSFVKPQIKARRADQNEIDMAFDNKGGMPVFPATVFARNSKHLHDNAGKFMQVKIPDDVFFHQMLMTGRTGSGKTVAMKYIAQYFIEKLEGAVLAVNVKEEDILTMDKPTRTKNPEILKEWSDLGLEPHGVDTFRVYYPGNQSPNYSREVDRHKCEMITLMTEDIDPETLTGLIQNISDVGADQLPAIFRYWKEVVMKGKKTYTLSDFIRYFADPSKNREYTTLNIRGEELVLKMHHGTYQNVLNALTYATDYFDVDGAKELDSKDILQPGKMSVIDVTGKYGFGFGSVLLRDLLEKIYEENGRKKQEDRLPVLIIIDEVHEFYGSARSREALQTLDAICRKGRSLKIGVIFSSQNPEDMPKGISSVVNTKIYFKSDLSNIKSLGVNISGFDPEALKPGYGVARVHGLSQLGIVKFPLSLAGVNDERN